MQSHTRLGTLQADAVDSGQASGLGGRMGVKGSPECGMLNLPLLNRPLDWLW